MPYAWLLLPVSAVLMYICVLSDPRLLLLTEACITTSDGKDFFFVALLSMCWSLLP